MIKEHECRTKKGFWIFCNRLTHCAAAPTAHTPAHNHASVGHDGGILDLNFLTVDNNCSL